MDHKIIVPKDRPESLPKIDDEQEELFFNEENPDKRKETKVPYAKIREKRNTRNKIAKKSRRKNRKRKK
jgi:hypothetical protein